VPAPSSADPIRLTAALVTAIRDLAASAGASFVLLNTGHRGEETGGFHALRPLLREARVPFLGLEETLGEARRARPEGYWDFGHDPHWNLEAHRLAAEVTNAFLHKLQLVE
jgi:hypothetical protein